MTLTLEALRIVQDDWTLSADLSVPTGARVAVLGPSGAGKSMLLNALAGFVPPATGRILWNGQDLAPFTPGARPVSILFQDNNLFPHLTAAQNVGLGLRPDLRLDEDQRARVTRAMSRTGLTGLEDRKPARLSGGQQSRVALARTLISARPLLLLDEPFAALGPGLRAEMLDLVAKITTETGATLLMVSHEPTDARRIAGQIIVIANGIAHPPRPTAGLFANPPTALKSYLGNG